MNTKYLIKLALLISLSVILSFVESLLPIPYPIPGAKLGLCNIITLYCLKFLDLKSAFIVSILRVFIVGFLFGSVSSIIYALSGAILSIIIMYVMNKLHFSLIIISILGGITHNLGQLILACLVTETFSLFYTYGIYLAILGFLAGLFIGLIATFTFSRLDKI